MKQGTTHRPTSHLVHCAFFWLLKAHRQQHTCVDDFAGQCLLWTSSSKTFFAPTLGLTNNMRVGRSWLFAASSIWFLTRSSLKSLSVHLAPHADNSIQLLSAVRSRRWKYNFMFHLLLDREGWIFVFLPWGSPQVGNQPLPTLVAIPLFLLPLILSLHLPLFLLALNSVQHRYPQHPIPSCCQQPQFHW